jgi:ATP-dependent Clp protease adaptor protein ClpS
MTTTVLPEIEDSTDVSKEKRYHVIILNDEEHTYEYVVEMLQHVFALSLTAAMAHTEEADKTGSSIVLTCGLDEAERKRDEVHAYGPDWRLPHSRGSVTALVEPAV